MDLRRSAAQLTRTGPTPNPTMSTSLEGLYQHFLATGDEAALDQLLRRSAPTLRRLATRLGANAEDAEDLVQETIVSAIQNAERFDPTRPLLPWLKGILTFRAARLARDEARRRRHYAQVEHLDPDAAPAPNPGVVAGATGRELDADVRAAIANLPEQYREPLRLFLLAGRSPVEIAHGLGLQRGTVRARLHRGLRRLRERLLRWSTLLLAFAFGRGATAARTPSTRLAPLAVAAIVLVALPVVVLGIRPSASGHEGSDAATAVQTGSGLTPAEPLAREERTRAGSHSTAELTVLVRDAAGRGMPTVGVTLTPEAVQDPVLHRRRAVTDAEGRARWTELAVGRFHVATDRGAARSVALEPGANAHTLDLPNGQTTRGRVLDGTGLPVPGAAVWLSSTADGPWRGDDVTHTDADGSFTLQCVRPGSFVAARHGTLARSEVKRVTGVDPLELRLGGPGGRIDLLVRDELGKPVADALVFVGEAMDASPFWLAQGAAPWRPPPFEVRTDRDGRASSGALAPGPHPVFVRMGGFVPFVGSVEVVRDLANGCTVVLESSGGVAGRVVDGQGSPISGACVVFRGPDPSAWIDVTTDVAGAFAFECTPRGVADVGARARGFAPLVTQVSVGPREFESVTLTLTRARTLRGTLARSDGRGTAGSVVQGLWPASTLNTERAMTEVAADGTFDLVSESGATPRLQVRLAGEPLWRDIDEHTTWEGEHARITLPGSFAATGWMRGRLRCDDGRALSGARLFVCRDGVQWAEVGVTDGEGAFRLGPLPPADYDLFAETTSPDLPTVPVGRFTLSAREDRTIEHTAPVTGSVELDLVRGDGTDPGDLAITLVAVPNHRRVALIAAARTHQVLLPGDYLLYVMGSRIEWLDGLPVHVDAGVTTTVRRTLPGATRCNLVLEGLSVDVESRPRRLRVRSREREFTATYTLAPDAPSRLAAVLAPGNYVIESRDDDGRAWRGTFAVPEGVTPMQPIVVTLTRR